MGEAWDAETPKGAVLVSPNRYRECPPQVRVPEQAHPQFTLGWEIRHNKPVMLWLGVLLLGTIVQSPSLLVISKPEGPLSPPRLCPKYRWEYPFRVQIRESESTGASELRFEVYCQSAKRLADAEEVSRALARLYEILKEHLKGEHPRSYHQRILVFLTEGGTPGGEQGIFEGPDLQGNLVLQNTIYIYHLESFADPVEKLREVAHEYGHAVLPPVGGFEEPEPWANGFLGEALFLYRTLEELHKGKGRPEDLFGVDPSALAGWVSRKVVPLMDSIWLKGVNEAVLSQKGERAMKEYVGLVLYIAEAFPEALPRALRLGGTHPQDTLRGFFLALEERQEWKVAVPERHRQASVWLPLPPKGEWQGARIIQRSGKWVLLKPQGVTLSLRFQL